MTRSGSAAQQFFGGGDRRPSAPGHAAVPGCCNLLALERCWLEMLAWEYRHTSGRRAAVGLVNKVAVMENKSSPNKYKENAHPFLQIHLQKNTTLFFFFF